jgi:hypothetical protein
VLAKRLSRYFRDGASRTSSLLQSPNTLHHLLVRGLSGITRYTACLGLTAGARQIVGKPDSYGLRPESTAVRF